MKAYATTGITGDRLRWGFDRANIFVDNMGEKIPDWDREVCYKGTATLSEVLKSDKWIKYDLLANILRKDEKIPLTTTVELFATGKVREMRIKKKRYRIVGTKYLGVN